ncbi:MAG: hypothetical protein ACT4OX_06825 [Actinomycetota bacterium]
MRKTNGERAEDRVAGDSIARAIEVLLFVPLGATSYLREIGPELVDTLIARGRAEVDRRHEQVTQHLNTARSMGEVALTFGFPKVRARVERRADAVRSSTADWLTAAPLTRTGAPPPDRTSTARERAPARVTVPVIVTAAANDGAAADARAALPIPGYDALSASQVVERLPGLLAVELDAVRDYESSHRNRRTILGKIDQLVG